MLTRERLNVAMIAQVADTMMRLVQHLHPMPPFVPFVMPPEVLPPMYATFVDLTHDISARLLRERYRP